VHCPNCGTTVEPSHTFCAECGDALDQDRLARLASAEGPESAGDDSEQASTLDDSEPDTVDDSEQATAVDDGEPDTVDDGERATAVDGGATTTTGNGSESTTPADENTPSQTGVPTDEPQAGSLLDPLLGERASFSGVVPAASGDAGGESALAALPSRMAAAEVPGPQTVVSTMHGDDGESPVWTFAMLGGVWFLAVAGLGDLLNGPPGASGLLAAVALLVGVPLLYLDAKGTIAAGGLPVDRPWHVVVGVYALYVVALPAYLCYRLYLGV